MWHASRVVAAVWITVLAFALPSLGNAQSGSSELFPKPESLVPAVEFWKRVYTEVTTKEGFIHDSLRLNIVYETIGPADDRERRRRIDRANEKYAAILNKLARGTRTGLSDEEARVLALFPAGVSNAELKAAAGRLRFQLGQADRFRAGLERSGTWKSYIHAVLDEQGLPRELAVLPHVESSFDPTAYSKVGASGMWQFTHSTGVRYMQIDHIVDERRDPFLATHAAARLLRDNHGVLGTWPLALTAYNHGAAGMRRAVTQLKTTDIGVIVQRYESRSFQFASRNFYAAFLAALEIDSNPEKYFDRVKIAPPSDTDTIVVPDFVPARILADALGVRLSTLRELNPALLETVWSGDKHVPKGFPLRLPRATLAEARVRLAGIEPSLRFASQVPDVEHRVRRGDTLSQIAAEYRVSLASLMRINNLRANDIIRVGQLIKLPVDAAGAAPPVLAAATAPSVTLARADLSTPGGTYVVRRGDSIERIANRLGIRAEDLLAANSLRNKNLIYAGQTLRLPGGPTAETALTADVTDDAVVLAAAADEAPGSAAEPEAVDAAALEAALVAAVDDAGREAEPADDERSGEPEANAFASVQADLAADPSDYTVSDNRIEVQALETLGHYADWLEIPTQRLRDLNRLSFGQAVVIGQRLVLDFSRIDAATFERRRVAYQEQRQSEFFATWQVEDVVNHVVRPGQSLWTLAGRTYKVPVWLLRQYNPDINLDRVVPGMVVKFPRLRAIDGEQEAPPQTLEAVADNAA